MSFIIEKKVFWRKIVLALFILSLMGPWGFDQLNVPTEYPCGRPSIRLEGDFCGYPMLGFQAFALVIGELFYIISQWATGTFTIQSQYWSVLLLLPMLPFFSTLRLIWKTDSRRLQKTNLIVWGLACIPTLMIFILQAVQIREQIIHLWGLWLYIVLAISMVILEILTLATGRIPKT